MCLNGAFSLAHKMRSCLGKRNSITTICIATQKIFWRMSFRETRAKKCVGTQIIMHKKLPKDTGKKKGKFFWRNSPPVGANGTAPNTSLVNMADEEVDSHW